MGIANGTYSNHLPLRFKSWKLILNLFMCSNKRPWRTYVSGGSTPHDLDFGTRLEVIGQYGTGIFYNNHID
jgi:hypothetical protein